MKQSFDDLSANESLKLVFFCVSLQSQSKASQTVRTRCFSGAQSARFHDRFVDSRCGGNENVGPFDLDCLV